MHSAAQKLKRALCSVAPASAEPTDSPAAARRHAGRGEPGPAHGCLRRPLPLAAVSLRWGQRARADHHRRRSGGSRGVGGVYIAQPARRGHLRSRVCSVRGAPFVSLSPMLASFAPLRRHTAKSLVITRVCFLLYQESVARAAAAGQLGRQGSGDPGSTTEGGLRSGTGEAAHSASAAEGGAAAAAAAAKRSAAAAVAAARAGRIEFRNGRWYVYHSEQGGSAGPVLGSAEGAAGLFDGAFPQRVAHPCRFALCRSP